MRPVMAWILVSTLAAAGSLGAGCGDDGTTADDDDDDDDSTVPDAAPSTPDAGSSGLTELIGRSWSIPHGEFYRCSALTLTQDVIIHGFRATAPLGTHHTVVTVSNTPTTSDGDFDCNVNSLEQIMLFASGVGTDDLTFPDGVAFRLRAGQQIHLNLHLFNLTNEEMSGDSGTMVETMEESAVEQEAEVVFGGTYFGAIDNTGGPIDASGSCTFDQDSTLFALWPHQHQLGTHHKVVLTHAGGEQQILHDAPYDFNEQKHYLVGPLPVSQGDTLTTTCTWVNDTDAPVGFGDSSNEEMCFTGIYRYPATGADLFGCVGFGGP
jgi:copper type II ascorbate-dependent monooxygenase-like protein